MLPADVGSRLLTDPIDLATQLRLGCLLFAREDDGAPSMLVSNAISTVELSEALSTAAARGLVPHLHTTDAAQLDSLMAMVKPTERTDANDDTGNLAVVQPSLDITLRSIEAEQDDAVRALDLFLYKAATLRASDLHLETTETGLVARARIDGVLEDIGALTSVEVATQALSRLKVLSQLDITERRLPQDGRFAASLQGKAYDCRVSVMPSILGEDAVVRLLQQEADPTRLNAAKGGLAGLGITSEALQVLQSLCTRTSGLVICSGPTGSGKTTTLYAALTEILARGLKVVTIEDPVEYRLKGALQIPVNERKGLTFARGLRSILRHDPDVIFVGEIRDRETAEIAVRAALTGHLVFTTLHANSAIDAFIRLGDMGVPEKTLEGSVIGLMAQRLVRARCGSCGGSPTPAPVMTNQGRGEPLCRTCRGSGFHGRIPVLEVVDLAEDDTAEGLPLSQRLRELRRRMRLNTLAQCQALVLNGSTTSAEIDRVYGGHT